MNGSKRSGSVPTLDDLQDTPSGPLSGPSNLTWRRQRLLQIGAEDNNETTPFARPPLSHASTATYGTLPSLPDRASFRTRRGLSALQNMRIPGISSIPHTPLDLSPVSLRKSYFGSQRPISAYDASLVQGSRINPEADPDVRTNGIRVWYSSFTSIDWLHDAIKDSVRRLRLRKRKSLRGRMRRQLDRSIGWIVVTIVGILTAIAAFLIVRSEQWLFDFKDGYCKGAWWKAQRFCCPILNEDVITPSFLSVMSTEATCSSWRSWAEVLGGKEQGDNSSLRVELVHYATYACIAVRLSIFHLSLKLTTHPVDLGYHLRSFNDQPYCL